jgi:glucose/arabinose dehydrogenase
MKTFAGLSVVMAITLAASGATVTDPNLKVQRWAKGFDLPTGMAFVDGGATALVLEKNTGKVQVMKNRSIVGTALDLPVANNSERGLLGIALAPDFVTSQSVYLYFTRSATNGDSTTAADNRVERYTWNGSKLVFSKRIIKLPGNPGPNHDGGKILFGPDKKLYVVAGELNRNERTSNHAESSVINPIGAILRLNPSGTSVTSNPFFSAKNVGTANAALNGLYAYGVRNSFGMDFDPVTNVLWDTENGAASFDEINRVRPGFNSGWEKIMGPVSRNGGSTPNLVSLGARAAYSDPKFSWVTPVAPTDLEFFPSSKLGGQYANDMFVGTVHGGNILHFDLSPSRKTLSLSGPLADGVADNTADSLFAEQAAIRFGSGFGTVTDLLAGPGGMYVVSLDGSIFRITENTAPVAGMMQAQSLSIAVPEPGGGAIVMLAALLLRRRSRGGREGGRLGRFCRNAW